MPHFKIDCSEDLLKIKSPEEIMLAVYEVAEASCLFAENDIKVRINPYKYFKLGEGKNNFIHIFGYIMEGRTVGQKADLSEKIITRLNEMFPELSILSINLSDFDKATYCNKAMIPPLNTGKDVHLKTTKNIPNNETET